MDRFDLHVALPPISVQEVQDAVVGDDTASVRARVVAARERMAAREAAAIALGGDRGTPLTRLAAELEAGALRLLHSSMVQLDLSLRAYAKVLKISRTIADLEGSERVRTPHVAEAIQYRLFDREASRKQSADAAREPRFPRLPI
jgi:magnesium chelatase family protein